MSEPIRYDFIYNENYASVEREEHKEGDYVSYEDYASLKAEVERLTKAGDAMADNCEAITSSEHDCYDSDLMKFVRAWRAAKEGKPNA